LYAASAATCLVTVCTHPVKSTSSAQAQLACLQCGILLTWQSSQADTPTGGSCCTARSRLGAHTALAAGHGDDMLHLRQPPRAPVSGPERPGRLRRHCQVHLRISGGWPPAPAAPAVATVSSCCYGTKAHSSKACLSKCPCRRVKSKVSHTQLEAASSSPAAAGV